MLKNHLGIIFIRTTLPAERLDPIYATCPFGPIQVGPTVYKETLDNFTLK